MYVCVIVSNHFHTAGIVFIHLMPCRKKKIKFRTQDSCTHGTFYKPQGAGVTMSQYLMPTQINRVNAS